MTKQLCKSCLFLFANILILILQQKLILFYLQSQISTSMNQTSTNFAHLEQLLRITLDKMIEYQHNGQYLDAQRCRIQIQNRKQELKNRQLYEMNLTHKRQINELTNQMNNELKNLRQFYTNKINQFKRQSDKNISEMNQRHNVEQKNLREELESQLSTKVKESSELLNLRKMEQQMAKQKNYVQAHRVQTKIAKLYGQQQKSWMDRRQQKINQALNNLRVKQNNQLNNLKQRIKTAQEDNTGDYCSEDNLITQKYQNTIKDLKAKQEREVLSFKGEFRTLGGGSPGCSPNGKSKIQTTISV